MANGVPTVGTLDRPENVHDLLKQDRGEDCLPCRVTGTSILLLFFFFLPLHLSLVAFFSFFSSFTFLNACLPLRIPSLLFPSFQFGSSFADMVRVVLINRWHGVSGPRGV